MNKPCLPQSKGLASPALKRQRFAVALFILQFLYTDTIAAGAAQQAFPWRPAQLSQSTPLSQSTSDSVSGQFADIEKLSQEIIKKQLGILTLCCFMWRENLTITKLWHWRRLFYRTFSSACATAGYTINTAVDFDYWRDPHHTPKYASLAATTLRFIGKNEVISSMIFERVLAALKARKTEEEGYDISTTEKEVEAIAVELNNLLKKREKLLAGSNSLSKSELELLTEEGKVLTLGRDQALLLYAKLSTNIFEKSFSQAGFDYERLLRRNIGAYLGNLPDMIREELDAHRFVAAAGSQLMKASTSGGNTANPTPSYIGLSRAGSLGTLSSGAMGALDPLCVFISLKFAKEAKRRSIETKVGALLPEAVPNFLQAQQKFQDFLEQRSKGLSQPLREISNNNKRIFDEFANLVSQMDEDLRNKRRQVMFRHYHIQALRTIAGGTKTTRGILKVIRDWDPYYFPAGRRELISAYAALVRIPGTGLQLADGVSGIAREFIWHKSLAEKRLNDSRLLASRLDAIELIDTMVERNRKRLSVQ